MLRSVEGHLRSNWAIGAMSGLPPLATELRTSLVVQFVLRLKIFNGLGRLPLAQRMSAVRSRRRYPRQAAPCTRIKHLVTCRSQYHMHLLLFAPPVGLAHLPTQFAA